MKNIIVSAVVLLSLMIFTSACGNVEESAENPVTEKHTTEYSQAAAQDITSAVTSEIQPQEKAGDTMKMTVNGKDFEITLENNDTVAALKELMPMTLDMSELNGNEKYYYLDTELPSASEKVGNINEGDIMLYGNNCLVVFYKSFSTPYSYTKIGHISDTSGLEEALGKGGVTLTFQSDNTTYTEPDMLALNDFLLTKQTSEDIKDKNFDLNGSGGLDTFDLCLIRNRLSQQ